MATDLSNVCYSCSADLSRSPKNRVIIRNRRAEYTTLYSMVTELLNREGIQMSPETVHSRLDGVMCKSCYRLLAKLSSALEAIEPIKTRMKKLFGCESSDTGNESLEGESNLKVEEDKKQGGAGEGGDSYRSSSVEEKQHKPQERQSTKSEEQKGESSDDRPHSSSSTHNAASVETREDGSGNGSGPSVKEPTAAIPKLTTKTEEDELKTNHIKSEVTVTATKAKFAKNKRKNPRVKKTMEEELSKRRNSENHTMEQLRIWAQTVMTGEQETPDNLPQVPLNRGQKRYQTSIDLPQAPPPKRADTSPSDSGGSAMSPVRRVSVRGQLFDQLAKWHKLNKDGVVSDSDYEELKMTILSDIKHL